MTLSLKWDPWTLTCIRGMPNEGRSLVLKMNTTAWGHQQPKNDQLQWQESTLRITKSHPSGSERIQTAGCYFWASFEYKESRDDEELRPISVLSVGSKVMERIVTNRKRNVWLIIDTVMKSTAAERFGILFEWFPEEVPWDFPFCSSKKMTSDSIVSHDTDLNAQIVCITPCPWTLALRQS